MEPIPVFRAAHMLPYIQVLKDVGAPVERRLRAARLPTMLADQPDAYLPLLRGFDFLMQSERIEGIDDLAVRGAQRLESGGLSTGLREALLEAPMLHVALRAICRFGASESPCIDWRVDYGPSAVKICSRLNVSCQAQGRYYAEWHRNLALVAMVRAFAGPQWCPSEMAFESDIPRCCFARHQFPDTRFLFGQNNSWIDMPRGMLSLPPWAKRLSSPSSKAATESVAAPCDFTGSIKELLKAYLTEGCPTIKRIAQTAGMSVRTLQRRLADVGLSYSELLERARFEAAVDMLRESEIKVIDVAFELGYEDPSNFARAFRRIAGVSPREYRQTRTTEPAGGLRSAGIQE